MFAVQKDNNNDFYHRKQSSLSHEKFREKRNIHSNFVVVFLQLMGRFFIFYIMQKDNNEKFLLELFRTINGSELKRFEEAKAFFSEAFLTHTSDEIFEDTNYRVQWANLINWMNDFCLITKTISTEDLDDLMRQEIAARLEVHHE